VSPWVAALRWFKLLMSQRFGTSAPSAENGFVGPRIVSSRHFRRNTRGKNVNIFKMRKIRVDVASLARPACGATSKFAVANIG
jgi:hypothetical protein